MEAQDVGRLGGRAQGGGDAAAPAPTGFVLHGRGSRVEMVMERAHLSVGQREEGMEWRREGWISCWSRLQFGG